MPYKKLISKLKNSILFVSVILLSVFVLNLFAPDIKVNNLSKCVIIDAGHGLPDGGAVAPDGTFESNLNLEIAKKLKKVFNKNGYNVIMTREDENSIYSQGSSIRNKKVSDIKNRIKIADENKNIMVLSIHMNKFQSSSVHGCQVFYNSDNLSNECAISVQNAINKKIQPDNKKTQKPIPKSVYLFNHIENPSVIIECGFLSNENDLNNLKDDKFQTKLAKTIFEGSKKFIS